ncbi:ARSENICAL PUMP-DRIVING ATPASE ARSENITE-TRANSLOCATING ATPASE [Salix viminalis]|uniref:ARSENICAL PUMP-DRIVING ATPASE ARSENITE-TRANSLOCATING ATPASE n=1 Tax=Salix viminalis TaxID=40686 RepID=A0A9Q0SF42_SALVM|nr:ARSENICAL PUMP-DRIVING ATPASE ARSENITE-TRANSLOCATING ATPASE [Salix viminalis]
MVVMTRLFGFDDEFGEDAILGRLEGMKDVIEKVNKQFKDPDLTTFVCVCIPEFLSLYETERLVQELAKVEIDTHNIIINQVLYDEEDVESKLLKARMRMQKKYLDQFYMLYDDFNITKLPLLPQEVTGVEALKEIFQETSYHHINLPPAEALWKIISVIQETWLVASAELVKENTMDYNEEKENADYENVKLDSYFSCQAGHTQVRVEVGWLHLLSIIRIRYEMPQFLLYT